MATPALTSNGDDQGNHVAVSPPANRQKVNFQHCHSDPHQTSSTISSSSASELLLPRRGSGVIMSSGSDQRVSFRRLQSDEPLMAGATTTTSSPRRRSLLRYDASHAMDRLRSTFIADDFPEHLHPPNLQSPNNDNTENDLDSPAATGEVKRGLPRKSHRFLDPLATTTKNRPKRSLKNLVQSGLGQLPAIVLIGMFHLMIGIPFGVSYFPVGWRSDMEMMNDNNTTEATDSASDDDFVHGPFPLPGKEALGIRMFLYSTIVAQVVFTLKSEFNNPIGLEMVENVPFYHELAAIAIKHRGYGIESLITLFFMFGIASLLVGIVFYGLGKWELGRIVYFFPMHVLVGCIGGIGLYIARTGLEVTMDVTLNVANLIENWNLVRVTILFEIILRVLERVTLDANGKPRYSLLSPIYFCMITPIFYVGLLVFQVPIQSAREDGYFFPAIETAAASTTNTGAATTTTSLWESILADKHMVDMFRILDPTVVSWSAIIEAIPTLVALILFSLIHVPINIPAFGISTNTDVSMNNELIAHGYSNFFSGLFGCGLQNYMAYTQSVVYDRSGGRGKRSGISVALVTASLFVVGPTIASFIPRCMAGALLLHVGIDLFLEGVYDSFKKFDNLEYAGIWLIVIVMSLKGMEAAMIAGVIAALSTYAMQSITYLNPIRGSMSAVTLRSSHRSRNYKATNVLDDPVNGRSRIIVIQLQGHLFFGNFAQLNDGINNVLEVEHPPAEINGSSDSGRRYSGQRKRRIVIIDFSLVVGIDSSAAQGLIKLRNSLQKLHGVEVCIFVAGSEDGFPCEFDLSSELTSTPQATKKNDGNKGKKKNGGSKFKRDTSLEVITEASSLLHGSAHTSDSLLDDEEHQHMMDFSGSFVLESLDLGLIFAENVLIAWEDPTLLYDSGTTNGAADHFNPKWKEKSQSPPALITDAMFNASISSPLFSGEDEEMEAALRCLRNICPDRSIEEHDLKQLLSYFVRETYSKDQFLWKQSDPGDCAKLIVSGLLIAILENEAGTSELVHSHNIIGELGLVQGVPRMSSVQCISEEGAVLYSLSREAYEMLVREQPRLARVIDLICIQYLANRVQHVSNRMIETRCLPI